MSKSVIQNHEMFPKRSCGADSISRFFSCALCISWCPYCEKVWLVLEEKKIPYTVRHIPMRCYGNNPVGGIPIATIDGVTIRESDDIIAILEQKFPERFPLLP